MSTLITQPASSSTSAPATSTTHVVTVGPPPQEKLLRNNFLLWKAIVLPQIKGAQMHHYFDPKSLVPPATIPVTTDGKEDQFVNIARTLC
ncbi:hypothetical protein D1007_25850 [Hordeum vulgare]|nr:hypothetical protein D1007_25850 [Hordeum vulgare]